MQGATHPGACPLVEARQSLLASRQGREREQRHTHRIKARTLLISFKDACDFFVAEYTPGSSVECIHVSGILAGSSLDLRTTPVLEPWNPSAAAGQPCTGQFSGALKMPRMCASTSSPSARNRCTCFWGSSSRQQVAVRAEGRFSFGQTGAPYFSILQDNVLRFADGHHSVHDSTATHRCTQQSGGHSGDALPGMGEGALC